MMQAGHRVDVDPVALPCRKFASFNEMQYDEKIASLKVNLNFTKSKKVRRNNSRVK